MKSRDSRQRKPVSAPDRTIIPAASLATYPNADAVLYLTTSGTVVSASGTPDLSDWAGLRLSECLSTDDADSVSKAVHQAIGSGQTSSAFQISISAEGGRGAIMTAFIAPDDDDILSLVLQDLEPLVEAVDRADRLQTALETQNDKARTAEGVQRALMAHLSEAVVIIDAQSGRIVDLSHPAAEILAPLSEGQQTGLLGAAFTQCFEGRRRSEFIDGLCAAAGDVDAKPTVVDLRGGRGRLGISPSAAFANGTRLLFCHLSTDGIEGARASWDGLGTIARGTADGLVCVDPRGQVLTTNRGFLRMVAAGSSESVNARPLASFLLRGLVDTRALFDTDRPRCMTTQLIGLTGQRLPVEITVTELADGGFGLVLRDISLADVIRPQADAGGESLGPKAASLVGSMPLRDIVSSMTEDIERDCVLAAIELTQNNRVACAEMLGLSRQSLYVKLRRFGLLDKDDL